MQSDRHAAPPVLAISHLPLHEPNHLILLVLRHAHLELIGSQAPGPLRDCSSYWRRGLLHSLQPSRIAGSGRIPTSSVPDRCSLVPGGTERSRPWCRPNFCNAQVGPPRLHSGVQVAPTCAGTPSRPLNCHSSLDLASARKYISPP